MKTLFMVALLLPLPALALEAVATQPTANAPRMSRSTMPICAPNSYIVSDVATGRLSCKNIPECTDGQYMSFQSGAFVCKTMPVPPAPVATVTNASCPTTILDNRMRPVAVLKPHGSQWVIITRDGSSRGETDHPYGTVNKYFCHNGVITSVGAQWSDNSVTGLLY